MQKRKYNVLRFAVVGIAFCLGLFVACKNDTDGNDETGNTNVKFINLEQYKVTVYRDSLRQNVFAEVAALGSAVVSAEPSASGTVFYPTFNLEMFDLPGIGVPYDAPGIVITIADGKTTDVPIPKLEAININSAFIKVINNSSSSLTLRQGGTEINLLGASYGIVAPNQSAVYEVSPGLVSGYSLMRNTVTPVAFPADITEFKRGIIYVLTYNGTSLTLTETKSVPGTSIIVPGSGLVEKLLWLKTFAGSNSLYTVEINADESIAPQTLSYSGKSGVTIAISGIEEMRTINLSAQGALFAIDSGVTLILDNNITLSGSSSNDRTLVLVGGTLIMNAGSGITSNTSSFLYRGGGVFVGGTFTMNGGEISGNTSENSGGGVYVYDGGTFTMNGGSISGNTASYNGGGVYVGSRGTFTMAGGEISGNTASYDGGGGVSVYARYDYYGTDNYGTFRMSGGVIYGSNAATELRNSAIAFFCDNSINYIAQAQYGTFSSDTFYPSGKLYTTDTTIRVVNGNLLRE